MPDPPPLLFFLLPSLLNKHIKKDLTLEERQIVLEYGFPSLKRGPNDGDDEWTVSSFECMEPLNIWQDGSK